MAARLLHPPGISCWVLFQNELKRMKVARFSPVSLGGARLFPRVHDQRFLSVQKTG
jgi:hypothetical protein